MLRRREFLSRVAQASLLLGLPLRQMDSVLSQQAPSIAVLWVARHFPFCTPLSITSSTPRNTASRRILGSVMKKIHACTICAMLLPHLFT
jgi:hypothetical protein